MAFIPTFPGVYIREIPSGARTIVGAPTSIAAFVGAFQRGPLDTPVRMFTLGDFDSDFGGVQTDYPTSFAVSQFFLNGGGQCFGVRVSPDAGPAEIVVQDTAGPTDTLRLTAGRQIAGVSLNDPGAWGSNLRFDVDHLTTDPTTQFNLTVSEIRDENGIEVGVRTEVYRNLTIAAGLRNAADVVNAESSLIQIYRDALTGGLPAPTGFYSGVVDTTQLPGIAAANTLDIDFGTGVQQVDVPVAAAPATLAEAAGLLQGAIRGAFPADRLWSQASVTVAGTRLRVSPGRASPDYDPETLVTIADNVADLAARLSLDAGSAQSNVQQYAPTNTTPVGFQAGATPGTDGTAPTATELRGSRATRTGLYALDDVAAFTMLAIPEASRLGTTANLAAVMGAGITYCQERRAMAFIDPPLGTDTIEECEAWLDEIANAGLRSEYSVAYVPNVQVPDPGMDNRPRSVAPSGTMAGVWARTDGQVGVWKAPAGIAARLNNVLALDFNMTDPENGVINPLGLNALRNFDIPGNVSWGARTLVGADLLASDWKYVPVRRMANFIESSLYDGLQWAVFQPNDEPLWNEMRSAARSFMQGLFRQGAFQGSSPGEAYNVKCDAETTTQSDINAGIVNIFVGFAPLRPAEFVVISLQLQIQQDA
jgi:Bacteriophage tail sheath protein